MVPNLKRISDHTLLGIMNGKIYVFQENKTPYEVYSEKYSRFIGFEYDPIISIILISARMDRDVGSNRSAMIKLILRSIIKNYTYDVNDWESEKYTSYHIIYFHDTFCNSTLFFKSPFIVTRRRKENFTFIFVPDCKFGVLRVYLVDINGSTELLSGTKLNHLYDCIGIVVLDRPVLFNSKIIKVPIAIIFKTYFVVLNFYGYIE